MARGTDDRVASLIKRGVLLFSEIVPFPASYLVAAIGAATISKIIEIHHRRVSEILSSELTLRHIPYVEPSDSALVAFYKNNPIYPALATQFEKEIRANNTSALRRWYPFLYNALVLKRQVPALLFHRELQQHHYRDLAELYSNLSFGYEGIEGDTKIEGEINHFASELLEVIGAVYDSAHDELRNKENHLAFDLIDYIREVSAS
jgi:hypothetical protein